MLSGLKNFLSPNSIDDFKSTIGNHKGLVKADRFMVTILPPNPFQLAAAIKDGASVEVAATINGLLSLIKDPRDISVLCESASLPSKIINVVEGPRSVYGNTIKIASGYTFEDVVFTFHLTNDFYVKNLLDSWMSLYSPKNNQVPFYPNEYSSNVIIQCVDENGTPKWGTILHDAWPQNVQSIELNNTSSDTTLRVSANFAFQTITPLNIGGIASLGAGAIAARI